MIQKVLFVNCLKGQCGVYEFGKMLNRRLQVATWFPANNTRYIFHYSEIQNEISYRSTVNDVKPVATIFNHHPVTMPWVSSLTTKVVPSLLIRHDTRFGWPGVGVIHPDPTFTPYGRDYKIGRPVPKALSVLPQVIPNSVGSFGFGISSKGYDEVIRLVASQNKQGIVRLLIPLNTSIDPSGEMSSSTAHACKKLGEELGVEVHVSQDYKNQHSLLTWLGQNEINAFPYRDHRSDGISSVIDWALGARRPIGTSSHKMFRHIYSDDISIEKNSLKDIVEKGLKPLEKYYTMWTPDTLYADLESILDNFLEKFK
jgi:hypothetical protein